MTRTLWTLVVASLVIGCTTFRVMPPPPTTEVSGRWVGTWKAIDVMNAPRQGQMDLDLAQDGARGRGRLVVTDSWITSMPDSVRLAGTMGSPVVFVVHGSSVVLRHERAAREFTMQLDVKDDEIVGSIPGPAPVEIRLTRVDRPGQATTGERLIRLEADAARERGRIDSLQGRVSGLAIDTEGLQAKTDGASELARQALAASGESTRRSGDTTTRIDELERLVREGTPASGTGPGRAVVHTLDVRFGFDKADLDDDGAKTLAEIVELLKENPEITAELEGYADALGSSDYNVRLSQRRVEAVHRHLARRGVPLERLHIVGLGQLPETSPEERARNRRVTIKLLLSGEE